jgi:hypothetical protein
VTSGLATHLHPDDPSLLTVYVRCGCGRRSTNLRISLTAAKAITGAELFRDGDEVGTWWCWRCKTVGVLTARALHFSGFIALL